MLLLIDNYDSFVHNLARYFEVLGEETLVVRNDAIDASGVQELAPSAVVLSPGPCGPAEAGCCVEVVRELATTTPMLGVCLGHQAIAEAFGGVVARAPRPVHGQPSDVRHSGKRLFDRLPDPLRVGRYHSLAVDADLLPETLAVTATSIDGIVMAIEHRTLPVFGVQFHPESILTDAGLPLLDNFLQIARQAESRRDRPAVVGESP